MYFVTLTEIVDTGSKGTVDLVNLVDTLFAIVLYNVSEVILELVHKPRGTVKRFVFLEELSILFPLGSNVRLLFTVTGSEVIEDFLFGFY